MDLVLVDKNSKLDYMLKQGHMITDHNFVHFYCELPSMERLERWINYRRLKDIDENAFVKDILNSFNNELGNSTSDIVNIYNKVLRETLNKHAPSKKKLVKQSHEIKLRRKKECDWNRDQTGYSYIAFVYQRKYVSNLIRSAQKAYYHQQFEEIRYNTKKVFQLANKLLFRKVDLLLPQNYSANALAEGFNNCFVDKIDKIMENLRPTQDRPRNELFMESQFITEKCLESFNMIDMPTLKKIVSKAPTKSCELDPLSTKLLK